MGDAVDRIISLNFGTAAVRVDSSNDTSLVSFLFRLVYGISSGYHHAPYTLEFFFVSTYLGYFFRVPPRPLRLRK